MTHKQFLIFVALTVTLIRPQDGLARPAYLLDTAGLGDVEELYLIGALQGIVNRDAPRLFLAKGIRCIPVGGEMIYRAKNWKKWLDDENEERKLTVNSMNLMGRL